MIYPKYEKALPSLGVNRKIKKQWQTLPEMYQGLSLLYFPLIAMAEKVSFLLCNWGFHAIAHSDALAMAYNNFLLEVGLHDNPFVWSSSDFEQMSTKSTWFQNLMLLVDAFNASILIWEEDLVKSIRNDDRSLMLEIYWLGY
jgi:hypothetical protein